MNSMWTVLSFTMRNKMRTKSFIITTVVIALLMTVVINLPYIISQFESDKVSYIGVIETEDGISAQLEQFFNTEESSRHIKIYPDQGSPAANVDFLKAKIREDEIKGYLIFEYDPAADFPKATYASEATMDYGTVSALQTALQQIKTQQVARDLLTPEQLAKIMAPVVIDSMQISTTEGGVGSIGEGKTESQVVIATIMVYILVIVLFMAVMITGQMIATEITAEKSSRVMEILITSVTPLKQMFGKIIGMLLVGLSQIAMLAAVVVINLMLPHNIKLIESIDLSLSDIDGRLLFYAILFYFLGYFLYATLYAAIGSIVSRTEDLGQAVMPVTFLSLAGFYVAIFGLNSPDATFVAVCSYIPFFTPFVMFLRLGMTDPALWEVWLSIGLLVASIFVMGWLSAKIYRTGVLMYGKRPSIKELRKAMKAYKV